MPSIPEYGKDLTEREMEVLNAFCRSGFTAKTVGLVLGISHRTVEIHMAHILVKLGAENQLHAVLMWDRAMRGGALQRIADMDPNGQRADDLGRAARTAREVLAADTSVWKVCKP